MTSECAASSTLPKVKLKHARKRCLEMQLNVIKRHEGGEEVTPLAVPFNYTQSIISTDVKNAAAVRRPEGMPPPCWLKPTPNIGSP